MGELKGRRSLDNGAQASRKPREDQEWGTSRRDLGELEPLQPPRLPLRRAGRTKGRPSVPPLGAWPSGGRFLPGSGQGLWSWHIPQTAGGQCAPWAPPPGPRAPTAGGTRAVQPVPLCPCAPGTTALPSPPSPPRGAVEPAPPAAPAAERTSGQRSRVPVARAPCPGSARPGCGPPPRPSPASAAVPAPPPGRQTCPGRHLPGGRRHLGVCSGRSSVLLNRVSCPGAVQGGFGWPFVGELLITQNLVSNRPDLFKSAESNLPFFNIYSGVCWKFATEFRLKLKVTRIYYCFLRMLSLMGCPLFI